MFTRQTPAPNEAQGAYKPQRQWFSRTLVKTGIIAFGLLLGLGASMNASAGGGHGYYGGGYYGGGYYRGESHYRGRRGYGYRKGYRKGYRNGYRYGHRRGYGYRKGYGYRRGYSRGYYKPRHYGRSYYKRGYYKPYYNSGYYGRSGYYGPYRAGYNHGHHHHDDAALYALSALIPLVAYGHH